MFARKRQDLPAVLARRISRTGSLVALLEDAVFRQDMRWIADQLAGRTSTI